MKKSLCATLSANTAGDADKPPQAPGRSDPCPAWGCVRAGGRGSVAETTSSARVTRATSAPVPVFPRVVEQDYAARYRPDVGPYNAGLALRAIRQEPESGLRRTSAYRLEPQAAAYRVTDNQIVLLRLHRVYPDNRRPLFRIIRFGFEKVKASATYRLACKIVSLCRACCRGRRARSIYANLIHPPS